MCRERKTLLAVLPNSPPRSMPYRDLKKAERKEEKQEDGEGKQEVLARLVIQSVNVSTQ